MDELGKSLPISEGMVDAEHGGNPDLSRKDRLCLNCGTPLTDKFCPHCGQKDIPKRQTLGELVMNFIGSFTSFESKFFQTVWTLMSKPGFLVKEYNSGRRERYYHPARAYVFISFIFFLLYLSLPGEDSNVIRTNNTVEVNGEKKNIEDIDLDDVSIPDSIKNQIKKSDDKVFTLGSRGYKSKNEYDSIQLTLEENKRDNFIERMAQYREIEINDKYEGRKEDFNKEFTAAFLANSPKAFFFLLPIFALILKLLYIRRDFFYTEHLVFTIYFYNFFFLAGIVTLLIELIPWMDWFSGIVFLGIQVYLWIAMRKVYQQGKFKTTVKYFLLNGIFFLFMGVALVVNAIVAFLQL
jgi:hypothetical protein